MSQPPFLGAGRRASVLRLIDSFDEVVRTGHPQLLTLEAPPGWGKTRIVQEFYALLAEQHQGDHPQYWPPSLHEASAEGLTPLGDAPEVRRKRIHPERFVPPAHATPTWFWWGISATGRSQGQSARTLLDDVVQIEAHSEALERRWREVSGRKDRLKDLLQSDESRQLGRTLGEESLGAMVETVANAAVPGLGLLTCAAELAWRRRERWTNRGAVAEIDTRALGQNDTLQTLAGSVGRFAAVGIPVLIIVEDLHDADQALVDLLVTILNGPPGPVLIVGTAWPAALDDPAREAARLLSESTPDRVGRLTAHELGELTVAELTDIVEWAAPRSDHDAARRLAEHYANPLALELACTVPRIAELLHDGRVTAAELGRLPRDVEALHRAAWKALPEDVRTALAIAALCTPRALCASMTADAWDVRLLVPLLSDLDWLEESKDGVRRALGGAPPANGWVRAASEWLRRFHEPLQYQLARNEAEDLYSSRRLEQLYSALVAATRTPDTIRHEEGRLLAQLRVALAIVGRTEWDDETYDDLDRLLEEAADIPSTSSQLLVIDLVRAAPHDPSDMMALHRQRVLALALAATGDLEEAIEVSNATLPALATVLGEDHEHLTLPVRASVASWHLALGRLKEAMAQQARVVERMTELYGPFDGTVLTARATLAAMRAEAGDVEAAVEELQVLSGGAHTVVGERAAASLRFELAHTLLDAGRANEAVDHFRQLVTIAPELHGPDSDFARSARISLGMALSMAGRPAEAIDLLLDVVSHQVETLGPRHPGTLAARHNLGAAIRADGQLQRAAAEFGSLVEDRTAAHGPVHPQTLDARMWLATTQSSLGNHAEAIEELARLVHEHVQTLGADHPQTLAARSNHAVAMGHAGRRGEELAILRDLVHDRTQLAGRRHPHTLLSRRGLLLALIAVDQREEASRIVTDLLEDHLITFGSGASETAQVARLSDELGQAERRTDHTSDGGPLAAEVSDAPLDVLRHMPRIDRAESPEELAAALADVESAIGRHRDAVPGSVWHEVGIGWERLTDWARAEQAYDRALELDADAATLANLCHVLLNQRRWRDVVLAGTRADAAEDSTEVSASAATDVAFAHLQMGDQTEAEEWLGRARDAGARPRRVVHVASPLQATAGDHIGAALQWESVESWAVHADRLRHPTTHELDIAFERLRVLAAAGHRAATLKPLMDLGRHHPWSAASLVRWFALESRLVGTGLRLLERFQEQSEALSDTHSTEHRLTNRGRLDDFPVGLFETQRFDRCAATRSTYVVAADEAYRLRALLRVGRTREAHDWLECDDPLMLADQLQALGPHALLVLDEAWHADAPWVPAVADAILTVPRFASIAEPTRTALSQLARGDRVAPPAEGDLFALATDLPHLTMRLLAGVNLADGRIHTIRATASSRAVHWHGAEKPRLSGGPVDASTFDMTLAALAHAIDLSDAPPAPSVADVDTALWWGEVMYRAQRDQDGDTYLERAISLADEDSAYQAGRNDPCPCGSGTKFKRCHGR